MYTFIHIVSQFGYRNYSMEIILQYEINYFMNVTTECCGSTVTINNFNFQLKTPNSQHDEIYTCVKLYFDCNPEEFSYHYPQSVNFTSTSKLSQ